MAIQEIVYTGTVTDIKALIEACQLPAEAYVLVEWQPKTIIEDDVRQNLLRFGRLKDKDAKGKERIEIASYTSGRVFNEEFELRWGQDAAEMGKTSVVYVGKEHELPAELERKATAQSDGDARQYYLFGERLDRDKQKVMGIEPPREYEYYAETRVPRLLLYPEVGRAKQYLRLQVVSREYRLTEIKTGSEMGRVYRFLKLIPADWMEKKT